MFKAAAILQSDLKGVATWCLNSSNATEDVAALCARIREESVRQYGLGMQLIGLIETLIQLHPTVVLDCFLAVGFEEWWLDDVFGVDIKDRNLIDKVPGETLLAWAKHEPDLRFPRLARAIKALKIERGVINWTETALALLQAAPNRSAVLQNLATRLELSSYSGSRADLLEQRRPLIQLFFEDDDPAVRQTARGIDRAFGRKIKVERSQETRRDERFE